MGYKCIHHSKWYKGSSAANAVTEYTYIQTKLKLTLYLYWVNSNCVLWSSNSISPYTQSGRNMFLDTIMEQQLQQMQSRAAAEANTIREQQLKWEERVSTGTCDFLLWSIHVKGKWLALFPGLLQLQYLIACSMQKWREEAWGISSRDPDS